ncbi:unnamed protein product [Mytilus edulis]|uniref:Apple domain-containing protein n=1 Tax=Mytilus edulis TaxID=6550 RepID=A0A8S3R6V9_MYTED|nr:unnamed protein product [Mytilus edulis]
MIDVFPTSDEEYKGHVREINESICKQCHAYADANIALRKPTKLSSVFGTFNSSYALDGDYAYRSVHGVFICAHSEIVANQQSWWAVDLQNVYVINEVDIFGRTDCCAHHLANFDVEIIFPTCTCNHWNNLEEGDNINCHYQATGSQRITVKCPPNTKGRFERSTIYACGKIGYGYFGPVLSSSVMKSKIQCTSTCITKTLCSAAEYDQNTNICTLKEECFNGTQSSLYPDNNKQVFLIQ